MIYFLLQGTNNGRKMHGAKWKIVCANKKDGALGVRRIMEMNITLLAKLTWSLGELQYCICNNIVCKKNGILEGRWSSLAHNQPYGCSLWRRICHIKDESEKDISFKLGRVDKIKFGTWSCRSFFLLYFTVLRPLAARRIKRQAIFGENKMKTEF